MHAVGALIQVIGGKSGDLAQAAFCQAYRAPAGQGRGWLWLAGRGGWRCGGCGGGLGFALCALGTHHAQAAKHPARICDQLFQQRLRQRRDNPVLPGLLPQLAQQVHIQPAPFQRVGIHAHRQMARRFAPKAVGLIGAQTGIKPLGFV